MAAFIALGGSLHNFYMWHGGNMCVGNHAATPIPGTDPTPLLTLSPHPYVPTGATMLALALLFGIGIFFGTGRDASGGKKR